MRTLKSDIRAGPRVGIIHLTLDVTINVSEYTLIAVMTAFRLELKP
jgi:hypothetical protein